MLMFSVMLGLAPLPRLGNEVLSKTKSGTKIVHLHVYCTLLILKTDLFLAPEMFIRLEFSKR